MSGAAAAGGRLTSMAVMARGLATDDTIEMPITGLEPMLVQPEPSTDPVDGLVAEIRARSGGRFVDGLQVAAMLEAQGVTDRAARVQFGYQDVFELAHEVRVRLAGLLHRPPRRTARHREFGQVLRELCHGALYLLPVVLFPAVAAVTQPRPPVLAIVAAGLLGWVWAGGITWLAYQHVNAGDERAAGRFLARSALTGVGVAALLGALIAVTDGGGAAVAFLVPAVTAYQLASTLLLYLRDEIWLVALMSPAVVAGAVFALGERRMPAVTLGTAVVCVAVTFAVAVRRALLVPGTPAGRGMRAVMRGRWVTFTLVVAHTALLAALILQGQVPHLAGDFDVLVAALPLVVSMGFVEWRARRFGERTRDLLHDPWGPRRFRRRIWLMLAADVGACCLVAAVAAVALLAALRHADSLTPAAAAMAAAQVALTGACFLIFVLAGHGGYGRLCVVLAVALGAHLAARPFLATAVAWPAPPAALTDTLATLGSAVLLLGLLSVALSPSLGRVRQYR
ncbi:hypothetical protein Daura_25550 [Dactylosporangium aurantiacum]|uniref:Integral membrane protein n=1 Tax=Dactylosporangium aurantiacum TaxID=35754 RepID=A0A9Q9ISX4_9ACTN|nr:hypothetical protein [Dactylosporangium aurantiacum]MDG6107988.1 hypothetical protein [Dactylosporangium aurantiacum]UWZ59227.1 hypothetical protein Daura_25550 [Dactylosporangium aurantiacum]